MNRKSLNSLLRQQLPDLPENTPFCPEDETLAEWFDGAISEQEYEPIKRHVTDCRFCNARIGFLARLQKITDIETVPGDLLASARLMGSRPQHFRQAPAWAAAAVVVLSVSLLVSFGYRNVTETSSPESSPTVVIPEIDQTRQLRSLGTESITPRLLSPTEGENVDPFDLHIRWTDVPGSLYYDLFVMSDAGDLVLETRVRDSQWSGRTSVELHSSGEYFVRVEAHLADSRIVSSEHVIFTVKGDNEEK